MRIIKDVAVDVAINTKYLSDRLEVNRKTIQRDIRVLQEKQLIQWVGPDKGGHWEIIEK
ncbi:MAG: HTH domain-containing protein [Paludibacteraceae bacterium]|nr:HTH domain-containing protein [Paludibacteraceae bacterium]